LAGHFGAFIWRVILAHLFGGSFWHIYLAGFSQAMKKQAVEQRRKSKRNV
jgi:hypothetical protein